MNVTVTSAAAQSLQVRHGGPVQVSVVSAAGPKITVSGTYQLALFFGNTKPNPSLGTKYLWVQTGLGTNGNQFEIWFEDGT